MIKQLLKAACLALYLFLFACSGRNTIVFYVSPKGDDANPGTEAAPFRTLEKAKESVGLYLEKTEDKTIVVNIKGGKYYLEKPVVFSARDSGAENAPVIYKAAEGEKPVFTGSRELNNWQVLDNDEKLRLLPPEVHGKVYVTDLKQAGIDNYGDPTDIGKRPELFCNGQLQTLARWPNEGFVKAGLAKGKTPIQSHGIAGTKEGIFEYVGTRQARWAKEKDARLGGYWFWDWSDGFQEVEKINFGTHTIYLKEPYNHYGYKDSLRYFGLNLFCEIDQPGEWYLDRQEGLLYWCPPEGVNPNKAKTTLPVFNAPYMIEVKDCSNITFQGLSFCEGRGSAILVSEGRNCLISDCRIERFGEDAVHIEGGSGHGVSGGYLSTFGCSGIRVIGGDRKSLTPAKHFVENTVVKNFSLFKRTYQPAVYAEGCGIRISNNRFMNSSSSAMRLEGNDITVEYNEINHVVRESDDQGGLDMWYNPSYRGIMVRYNRWSDIKGGTKHGAAGVRLDDMISGVTIFGNIFERCGALNFGGVQIHGGKDNVVENNLFYDCLAAVSFSPWSEAYWLEHFNSSAIQKKIFEEVDINSELYQNRYPKLKTLNQGLNVNIVKNNLLVDCENSFLREKGVNILENNPSIESEGKALENFCKTDLLKKYGLQPIPLEKMGPQKNIWIGFN